MLQAPGLEGSLLSFKFHMGNLGLHLKLKREAQCRMCRIIRGGGDGVPGPSRLHHFTTRTLTGKKKNHNIQLHRAAGSMLMLPSALARCVVLSFCRCRHRSKEAKCFVFGHTSRKGLRQHSYSSMGTPGLPRGLSDKEPPANAGDAGSIPESGRSPGGGHGNPLQYFRLENPKDRGAWRAAVYGVTKESDMTE